MVRNFLIDCNKFPGISELTFVCVADAAGVLLMIQVSC